MAPVTIVIDFKGFLVVTPHMTRVKFLSDSAQIGATVKHLGTFRHVYGALSRHCGFVSRHLDVIMRHENEPK